MTEDLGKSQYNSAVAVQEKEISLSRSKYQPKSRQSCLGRQWRYWYFRLLRLRGKPPAIARGFALGVFAGCFPLFGFQTIVGIILAAIFQGNKIAAAAGTWISNPFTYIPIFAFNYKVGELFLGWDDLPIDQRNFQQNWQSWGTFKTLGGAVILKLVLGCFIVGIIVSFFSYIIALRLFKHWRKA